MRIALDIDDTYTRDPQFWDEVVRLAQYRKHEVVVVTMRRESEGNEGLKLKTIYTDRKPKRAFCDNLGESFSVWIDDSPEFIVGDF